MSKGKALVQELIKNKKVLMVSKTYCPFCVKAKDALKNYKVCFFLGILVLGILLSRYLTI